MPENWKDNIYEKEEKVDMALLTDFAKDWPEMFYVTPIETPYGKQVDAMTVNHTGGTVAIETKLRKKYKFDGERYGKYGDIYIEPGKYRFMMGLWTAYNVAPLFINFFNDGNDAVVFILPALMRDRFRHYQKGFYNPDTGKWEERFGIPLTDGIWYTKTDEGWVKIRNAQNQKPISGYAACIHEEEIAYLLRDKLYMNNWKTLIYQYDARRQEDRQPRCPN